MDPDAALANIRELIVAHWDGQGDADALAAAVADLDAWLCKGGFPPADWRH